MFSTGEFAKIARVSKRQLQYYDEIGLFAPEHTDAKTGYRSYSAQQLPRLNRILALKELGLTLDQITQLIDEGVSDDEIQAMFAQQKRALEDKIMQDLQRLRRIESRLQRPTHDAPDVVLKRMGAQRFLAVDHFCVRPEESFGFIGYLLKQLADSISEAERKQVVVMSHLDDFIAENVELEFGFYVSKGAPDAVELANGQTMRTRMLPSVEQLATISHVGMPLDAHIAYGHLARWIQTNGYRIAGQPRDTFIDFPANPMTSPIVMEIQIPVESVARSLP